MYSLKHIFSIRNGA